MWLLVLPEVSRKLPEASKTLPDLPKAPEAPKYIVWEDKSIPDPSARLRKLQHDVVEA